MKVHKITTSILPAGSEPGEAPLGYIASTLGRLPRAVLGVVIDKHGNMTSQEALTIWNEAHPDYPGDSSEDCVFVDHPASEIKK